MTDSGPAVPASNPAYDAALQRLRNAEQTQRLKDTQQQQLQQLQPAIQDFGTALGNLLQSLTSPSDSPTAPARRRDLSRYDTPADPPELIYSPAQDPRKVEEQKRLDDMRTAGLLEYTGPKRANSDIDKWADDVLSGDSKKFMEAMFGNAGRGQTSQQSAQLPEYKTRQQTIDEWNNFTTQPKIDTTQSVPKQPTPVQQKASDDWNNFDTGNTKPANGGSQTGGDWVEGGVPKWKNGPTRKPDESDWDYKHRVRKWQEKEDYEDSRKRTMDEFYHNIETGRFRKRDGQ